MTGWVPLTVAAKASRRPVRTVRSWAATGRVTVACRLPERTLVVWWADVYDLTFTVARRVRHADKPPAAGRDAAA